MSASWPREHPAATALATDWLIGPIAVKIFIAMNTPPEISYEVPSQSEVLVWVLSAEGEGEFFSPSWLTFTGHGPQACLGSHWLADVHPDNRSPLAAAIESAIKTRRTLRQRVRLRRHDGEYVWHMCEGIIRLNATGEFVGLIGVCSDITREVRDSTQAELNGRHFVDLLPQTDMLALALDNTGRTLFFNQALTEALGRPADELAQAQNLSRFLDREHRPLTDILFPQGQRSERFPALIESEFIEGRDARHIYRWHVIPLRDYAGNVA